MKNSLSDSTLSYGFVIGGTHSGCGKTTLTAGLIRWLTRLGKTVQPFKCGPDYIDPDYLTRAAKDRTAGTLDFRLMGDAGVKRSFLGMSCGADIAVAEGVMGLYDGAFGTGYHPESLAEGSTAEIAVALRLPVLLTLNVRGLGQTLIPLIRGMIMHHSKIRISGIVANQVGSESHAALIRELLIQNHLPPLITWLGRHDTYRLPERHLGLTAACESSCSDDWFEHIADALDSHMDLPAFWNAVTLHPPIKILKITKKSQHKPVVRLGIAQDDAFHFYYPDNLEMLREQGIELIPFSPLNDFDLPPGLAGLYIGGGFPEQFAARLSENKMMRDAVRQFCNAGFPVYAECGGLMYLTRFIRTEGKDYPMCGVFPSFSVMGKKAAAMGYVTAETIVNSLLGPVGTHLSGHEFHWSEMSAEEKIMPSCRLMRSRNPADGFIPDGAFHLQTYASYVHIHFGKTPSIPVSIAAALRNSYANSILS